MDIRIYGKPKELVFNIYSVENMDHFRGVELLSFFSVCLDGGL